MPASLHSLRFSFFRPLFFLLALFGMELQQSQAFAQTQTLASLLSKLEKVQQNLGISVTDLAMNFSERYSDRQDIMVISENHIIIRDEIELMAFVSDIATELGVYLPMSAYPSIADTTTSVITSETLDNFLQTAQNVFGPQLGMASDREEALFWAFLIVVLLIFLNVPEIAKTTKANWEKIDKLLTPPTTQPAMQ